MVVWCQRLPGRPGWLPTQAPHRPVRAGLPHTVPQVTGSLRDRRHRTDPRVWERVALQEEVESLPGHVGGARAPTKPLAPDPLDPVMHAVETLRVSGQPVILVVPAQLAEKPCMLPSYGCMPIPLTPLIGPLQGPGEPVGRRLALHHPKALARLPPEMG